MKPTSRHIMVLVTAPDLDVARSLAQGALQSRLVACVNLVPQIESRYWWQGKIESGAEVLCIFKTTKSKLAAFEKSIISSHPYDTPEIISLPITSGARRYLDWISASVKHP